MPPIFDPQSNRAYYRAKNAPKPEKADLILERLMADKPDPALGRMSRFLDEIRGEKPVAGVDYPIPRDGHTPTERELLALIKPLIPEVKDGKTPIAGVDFEVPDENKIIEKTTEKVLSQIPIPEPGKDAVVDEKKIVKAILKLLPEVLPPQQQHSTEDIVKQVTKQVKEDLIEEDRKFKRKMGPMMGGGTLANTQYQAGTGIAITGNTISASGGGTGYIVETPSGTIDGSNLVFTVTAIPVYVVTDLGTFFENFGYTRSGLTITMAAPPTATTGFIRSFHQ
jgi:hypothetical protein